MALITPQKVALIVLMFGVLMIMGLTVFAMADDTLLPTGHELSHAVAVVQPVQDRNTPPQHFARAMNPPLPVAIMTQAVPKADVVAVEDSLPDPYPQTLR